MFPIKPIYEFFIKIPHWHTIKYINIYSIVRITKSKVVRAIIENQISDNPSTDYANINPQGIPEDVREVFHDQYEEYDFHRITKDWTSGVDGDEPFSRLKIIQKDITGSVILCHRSLLEPNSVRGSSTLWRLLCGFLQRV